MFLALHEGFLKTIQHKEHWTQDLVGFGQSLFPSLSVAPCHVLQSEAFKLKDERHPSCVLIL